MHQHDDKPKATAGWQTIAAPAIGFLLLVAFSPVLNHTTWAPRLVLAGLLGALGLPLIVALAKSAVRPGAWFAIAFLALSVLSAALARRPALSFLSSYGNAGSVILVVSIVGAWALGATLDERGRRRLASAIVLGVLVNVVVAWLQAFVDMEPYRLSAPLGSAGLLGNPVHLGALLAGAVALPASRVVTDRLAWLVPVAIVGATLPISGSRVGAVAALVVAVTTAVTSRAPLKGALVVVVLVLGFAAGEGLQRVAPEAATSTTRKFATTHGIQIEQRLDGWSAGVEGALSRPLGYGPGRYVEASAPRTTLRLAKASPDTLYLDAHDLLVEYLATTGLPGLLTFAAFLGLTMWCGRGPFLWFGVGMLLVYLMQPQSLATMPVLFLALGAAGPKVEVGASRAIRSIGRAVLVSGVVVLAAVLFVGDFALRQADLDFTINDARTASRVLWAWPESASKAGQVYFFNATAGRPRRDENRGLLDRCERALRTAAERDPSVPNHWSNLADLQLYRGELDRARVSFGRALDRNPYSLRALIGLAAVERGLGNDQQSEAYIDRAARIIPRATVEAAVEQRVSS